MVKTPPKKVFRSVFRGLKTFSEGLWSPREPKKHQKRHYFIGILHIWDA